MSGARVDVLRGDAVESRHRVHVAVADAAGRLVAGAGETRLETFARSAVKPIQALPLVEAGGIERFGLPDTELALCCASHSGEAFHVAAVRSILGRIDGDEEMLACGPHPPFHEPTARALVAAGTPAGRLHNNCSGKHAGMLALAHLHGWPAEGYHRAEHPVQRRMLEEVARWTEVPAARIGTGVDGCGVVTFAVPLASLAAAFARLGAASREAGAPAARVVGAMTAHPESVAGTGRLCTALMRLTGGRIIAKVGAEGVYCAGVPAQGIGVAVKVEDGAKRAAESGIIGVLRALDLLSTEEYTSLAAYAEAAAVSTRGEPVGRLRPVIALERRGG